RYPAWPAPPASRLRHILLARCLGAGCVNPSWGGRMGRTAQPGAVGVPRPVRVAAGGVTLQGDLTVPPDARGVVLFAHGSGSSRHSPRNRFVAGQLQAAGLATLLADLLTAEEEAAEARTRHLRFDIDLLA